MTISITTTLQPFINILKGITYVKLHNTNQTINSGKFLVFLFIKHIFKCKIPRDLATSWFMYARWGMMYSLTFTTECFP